MEEPLKEPTIIAAPPIPIATLFLSLWVAIGVVTFRALAPDPILFRLLGALVGGFIGSLVLTIVFLIGAGWWHRPMTAEERAEWEKENTERAARIRAAREARERKLRQVREGAAQLIAEMEADPAVASMLRDVKRRAPKDAGEQLLARAEIAIAGLGGWLTEQGMPNQLPGHLFGGAAKSKIKGYFASINSKERAALQKYLPRVAQVLEEALEVMSPRKVVKEILLPLFFGETTNQAQDK